MFFQKPREIDFVAELGWGTKESYVFGGFGVNGTSFVFALS
jgi:hypothetical protein